MGSDSQHKSNTSVDNGCALEALSSDIFTIIISACSCLDDLGALIHASPAVCRIFLSARATYIVQVVISQLGPGTRDATLLATTTRFSGGPDFEARVDTKVRDYRQRLNAAAPSWVTAGLDADAAIALAKDHPDHRLLCWPVCPPPLPLLQTPRRAAAAPRRADCHRAPAYCPGPAPLPAARPHAWRALLGAPRLPVVPHARLLALQLLGA